MQGVWTTILQAAHFLRDTDFCCGKQKVPEASGNPGPGATPRLPQHSCAGRALSSPVLASGPSPVPLAVGGSPLQGGSGKSLAPTLPWEGRPTGLEIRLHHQGAACRTALTHQHLGDAVLLSDVAEVPGHVGLEPDVFPIGRRLLEHGTSTLGARLLCPPPPLPRQTCSSPHNLLCCTLFSPLLASRLGPNVATLDLP